jgi:hypothetical protein
MVFVSYITFDWLFDTVSLKKTEQGGSEMKWML